MRRAFAHFLFSIVAATFCVGAGPTVTRSSQVRIGVVLNPEGRFFLIQRPIYDGIRLFFDDKPGYDLRLIAKDDSMEGQKRAADETAASDLRFVIGHNFSGLAEIYLRSLPKAHRLTYVSPFATSSGLTGVRDGVHLVWPDNDRQIRALVAFALDKRLSMERVMVVVNESETYSEDMADLFSRELGARQIKVQRVSYIRDAFHARTLAEKIAAARPTILFLPIYNRELIELYQSLWEAFPDKTTLPAVLCGDTTGDEGDFYKMLGHKVEIPDNHFFFANGFAKELLRGTLAEFSAAYRKKYGVDPSAGSLAGYHAAQVMYELIRRDSSVGRRKTPIKVAGWDAHLDEKGRLIRPLVINEVTRAGFRMREVVND